MGKNRDKVGIIAAILQAANSGSTKTHIMHIANLSYKPLEKYLKTTLQLGFIKRRARLFIRPFLER